MPSDAAVLQWQPILKRIHGAVLNNVPDVVLKGISAVFAGQRDLLVVAPTGSGKTDAWLVPVLDESSGLTVIVVPYTSLVSQTAAVCRQRGIRHSIYNPGPTPSLGLIRACGS